MLGRVQRWWGRFSERYGQWMHLLLLLLLAYLLLSWVLHRRKWGTEFRTPKGQAGAVRTFGWYSAKHGQAYDEFEGWKLLGTMSTETGERLAVVSNGTNSIVLRPGEAFGGEHQWRVAKIEHGVVTLTEGKREQSLALVADNAHHLPVGPRDLRIDLNRRLAGELFPQLLWGTVPMGGDFVGLRLHPPISGRNSQTFGLVAGDTIEFVNGLPIVGAEGRDRLAERFRNDDNVKLGIRRQGRLINLHFSLYD